jgi:general nucleoside transport system permease protein
MKKYSHWISYFLTIFGVFAATMIFGAIIMLFIGANPLEAYGAMFSYALGSAPAIVNILNRTMALTLSGLCASVAFNAGIYNLGAEGQIFLGAMAAAVVGFSFTGLPLYIHLPLCILAGVFVGIVGAAIPGFLRVVWRVDEVISTIMLNSVFFLFTSYLATYPFRDPDRWSGTTPTIADTARLPFLVPGLDLRSGILISIAVAVLLYYVMQYTDIGYRWKMIGLNPQFSRYGGLKVQADQMRAMILSGALSGLAGAVMVTGSVFRYWDAIARYVGWDGVLIAMLAKNNPLGVVVSSVIFAIFKNGALGMETVSQVPSDLTAVLLATLILFVTGRQFISMLFRKRKNIVQVGEGE